MHFFTVTLALAATTLASPLTPTRRSPVPNPIPNAGSFTSWSCIDCAANNPCLSFPHDNIVSDECYPLEPNQASLQVLRIALRGCELQLFDSVDCSEGAGAPYVLSEPPTCDPVPVFKRGYKIVC